MLIFFSCFLYLIIISHLLIEKFTDMIFISSIIQIECMCRAHVREVRDSDFKLYFGSS